MKKSKVSVLKDYFGFRAGEKLRDFSAELKELSAEEKLELAQGAAKELGMSQKYVDFPLA